MLKSGLGLLLGRSGGKGHDGISGVLAMLFLELGGGYMVCSFRENSLSCAPLCMSTIPQ